MAKTDPDPKVMTKKAVEKLVDKKLAAFEAELVVSKRIQPAPE